MLMVYFTIFDLPDEYASRVDSIFVVMAGRYNSIKSEGQEIFRRLVNDLKILEKGIVINGETVKAGLLAYCGDNLESHTVGGFQTHFHAGYVCRFCVINYKEIPEYVLSQYPHRWTKERYDELALDLSPPEESILELLEIEDDDDDEEIQDMDGDDLDKDEDAEDYAIDSDEEYEEEQVAVEEVGVRGRIREKCIFNELNSFHAVTSFPPDIFHDLLEGGVSQDCMGYVRVLELENSNMIKNINDRIINLPISIGTPALLIDVRKTKKSENLPGKGMQNYAFLLVFPYLVEDWMKDEEDTVFKCIRLLSQIIEMSFSNSFTDTDVDVLDALIATYFRSRNEVNTMYPGHLPKIKPKHHFLTHMPENILQFGPPICSWTARFEAKHRLVVNLMEAAKNFRNTPKTICERLVLRKGIVLLV